MNTEAQKEGHFITNSGIAIISPFLPRFFNTLQLTVDNKFINDEAATRALLLIQYIISGELVFREHDLILNKVICDVEIEKPVPKSIDVTREEIEEVDSMLKAAIENWKILKNTSIKGFRESFLIRRGRIIESEKSWTLDVESRSIDILLNQIPWPISFIKLPWMKKLLRVEWNY